MTYLVNPPTIALDQLQWQLVGGDEESPATRMLAQIRIGDLDMHLEAREVTTDDQGCQTTIDYPDDHGTMCNIADTSFQTLMIGGREYFLFALPYGD